MVSFINAGELLTVAPWAARTMPGLFVLNERVVLFGQWHHGSFCFAAVGAYNVGSINLAVDGVSIAQILYYFCKSAPLLPSCLVCSLQIGARTTIVGSHMFIILCSWELPNSLLQNDPQQLL